MPLIQLSRPTIAKLFHSIGESFIAERSLNTIVINRLFFHIANVLLTDRSVKARSRCLIMVFIGLNCPEQLVKHLFFNDN